MPASPTPIDSLLEQIAALEDATQQNACDVKKPFINLGNGDAPTLNYNVPQNTAFTTYGTLAVYIPPECFKAFTLQSPVNNFYTAVASMNAASVSSLIGVSSAAVSYAAPASTALYATGAAVTAHPAAALRISANPALTVSSAALSHVATTFSPAAMGAPVAASMAAPMAAPMAYTAAPAAPTVVANYVKNDPPLRPIWDYALDNVGPKVTYIAPPKICVPKIVVIEEYTTASYLGDYGAGRVVNAFSLFPGERTTISVSTYRDISSNTTTSTSRTTGTTDTVIDSMSHESAEEFDDAMQYEQGNSDYSSASSSGSGSSYSTQSDSQNSTKAWNVGGSLNIGPLSVGGGYGQSKSQVSTSSGGQSNTYGYSNTGARSSNVNVIDSAVKKTAQYANNAREKLTSVNTSSANSSTSSISVSSGESSSTVREIYNPNVSCTLNIIARILLQQYTTITYLSNLKFGYTNGYYETNTIVDLANLDNMLKDIINPDCIDSVLCTLLSPYCSVMNYNEEFKTFIERVTVPNADCIQTYLQSDPPCVPAVDKFWRIAKSLSDTYTDGVIDVTVHGVILSVKKITLVTPSIIWEALLGQGNALDCFNQKAQDSTATAAYINNLHSMQRLDDSIQTTSNNDAIVQQQIGVVTALGTLPDISQQALLYKKVFGDCCDVPQSGCPCPTP